MNEILASHTGRPLEQIARDTERDYYLGADEAQEYGIVDAVANQRADAPVEDKTPGKTPGKAAS